MSSGKRICALLLAVAISFLIVYPIPTTFAVDYFYKSYEWDYGGNHWTTTTYVPKELYYEYNDVSVYERTKDGPAGYGFLVTTQDQYVIEVANSLHDAATRKGYGAYDEVSLVLSFVQSLRYTSDSVSTLYDEYPRFPVETLVDDGGDCEDTSILFATLVLILNYDVVFINPPGHYAVGVLGKDLYGSYYTYNNKKYYYCETTGDNFRIGDVPSEYQGASAYLYPINQSSQYTPIQSPTPNPGQGISLPPIVLVGVLAAIIYLLTKAVKTQKLKEVNPPTPPPPPPDTLAHVLKTAYF